MLSKQTIISQSRRIRIINAANFIIQTGCTIRDAAKEFNVSRATIYRDMTVALPKVSETLANDVDRIFKYNRSVMHLRGGESTHNRYCKRHNE